jgi:hypothetical protein
MSELDEHSSTNDEDSSATNHKSEATKFEWRHISEETPPAKQTQKKQDHTPHRQSQERTHQNLMLSPAPELDTEPSSEQTDPVEDPIGCASLCASITPSADPVEDPIDDASAYPHTFEAARRPPSRRNSSSTTINDSNDASVKSGQENTLDPKSN